MNETQKRLETIYKQNNQALPLSRHLAGRMIEEMVELMCELGSTPADIMTHVMDAIENECRKENVYPSELKKKKIYAGDISNEMADVNLIFDLLCRIEAVSEVQLNRRKNNKLEKLEKASSEGSLHFSDKRLFYREKR